MQLNVARLLKGSVGTSQHCTLNVTLEPQQEAQADRVRGALCLTRVDRGVWVSGALEAKTVCACSRCLRDFRLSAQFHLDDIYFPVTDIATGAPLPLPEDADPGFTIDQHHVLDITEAVRQSTILALPMKPLCRADCAGICPECGVNRNEAPCSCQSGGIDPRWTPLLNQLTSGRVPGINNASTA